MVHNDHPGDQRRPEPSLDGLVSIVGENHVLTDAAATAPYLQDWRRTYRGKARAVVRPVSTDEVARCLKWATQTKTPVVPQGGNTGMSGGATPDGSGQSIVLSLERLKRIRAIDPMAGFIQVDAGCILADIRDAAAEVGKLFPLGLGSAGSCQIGGNIATDAGGIEALRYGTMRDLVLGVEVVLPSGEILDLMSPLRKNTSGYNLKHLFIGSEGTLGVITGAALKLFEAPMASRTAFCALARPADGLALLQRLRQTLGDRIVKCELMSHEQLALVLRHHASLTHPLDTAAPWYLLIELALEQMLAASGEDAFEQVLSAALDDGVVSNVAIPQNGQQAQRIWEIRELVSDANRRSGRVLSTDTAVPLEAVPVFLDKVEAELSKLVPNEHRLYVGHIGDGNVHVVVVFQSADTQDDDAFMAAASAVRSLVFDITAFLGGSISAEHGVGQSLASFLPQYKSSPALATMALVKQALDPLGLMNPGKVLMPSPQTPAPSRSEPQ